MKKQWLRKIGLILISVFVPETRLFLIMESAQRECLWRNMSMQWNDLD